MPNLAYCLWDGWWVFGPLFPLLVGAILLFYWTKFISGLNESKGENKVSLEPPTQFSLDDRLTFYFLLGWLGVSFASISIPTYKLSHHGIFLLSPMIVVLSFCLSQIKLGFRSNAIPPSLRAFSSRALVLLLLFTLWLGLASSKLCVSVRYWGVDWENYSHGSEQEERALEELCQYIETKTQPKDNIVVWGWVPEAYVLSGRTLGSRYVISHFLIGSHLGKEVLINNFVKDIKETQPLLFIDALTPGFHLWWLGYSYEDYRAEKILELKPVLETFYHKVAVLDSGTIIYRRID